MNKKGQALVEFIIIIPILVFILLAIIDYVNLSYNKSKLENIIVDVGNMCKNNESEVEINNFIKSNDKDTNLEVKYEDKYIYIKLTKPFSYITPGMDNIFKTKSIVVERKIYNE